MPRGIVGVVNTLTLYNIMESRKIFFRDLGLIEYAEAWELQEALLQKGLQEKARWQNTAESEREAAPQTTDHLFFCEHPHVYTLGKSGDMGNLLADDSKMAEINASFYKTNRGGGYYLPWPRPGGRLSCA